MIYFLIRRHSSTIQRPCSVLCYLIRILEYHSRHAEQQLDRHPAGPAPTGLWRRPALPRFADWPTVTNCDHCSRRPSPAAIYTLDYLISWKTLRMASREASHAGSWYSGNRSSLTRQLDQWLGQVPDEIEGVGSLPVPGARVIIAPYVSVFIFIVGWCWFSRHAGYAYSGPCAAHAYKALDLSKA